MFAFHFLRRESLFPVPVRGIKLWIMGDSSHGNLEQEVH